MAAYSRDYECSKRIFQEALFKINVLLNKKKSESELKNQSVSVIFRDFAENPIKIELTVPKILGFSATQTMQYKQTELKTIIGYIYKYI